MAVAYGLIGVAGALGLVALWADGLALWFRGLLLLGFLFTASMTDWVRCRTGGMPVFQPERELGIWFQQAIPRACPGCGQDRMWRAKLKWFGWYRWM